MVFQAQQAVRAAILLFFTVLIFKFHYTGEITKFINPKYIGLSQIASVLFLILFFIQITRIWEKKVHHHDHECSHNHGCDHNHDHGNTPMTLKKVISYVIIAFPLITGFALPAKVLDSSIAEKKGGMAVITGKSEKASSNESTNEEEEVQPSDTEVLPNPYGEITQEEMNSLVQKLKQSDPIVMDDYVYYLNYEEISKDVSSYKGKEITLKGFVYKEEGFQTDQLVISRFLITHCVADASIIGFLTQFDEAATLEKDTWVEATGVLDVTTYNGMEMPFIKITDWKTIEEPSKPYLFPLNVRIL
ncbi:TIGR03943 family putative permease subunit [Robertmurraya korlensis]|uniref:TIGR03943 family putative permease subunit n=1 Tax=Robertmurraya korlensis TaxID=519977 RepID=UPI0008251DA1|nr:TIGR03943 family protein [Robertmurraya korlensis]